ASVVRLPGVEMVNAAAFSAGNPVHIPRFGEATIRIDPRPSLAATLRIAPFASIRRSVLNLRSAASADAAATADVRAWNGNRIKTCHGRKCRRSLGNAGEDGKISFDLANDRLAEQDWVDAEATVRPDLNRIGCVMCEPADGQGRTFTSTR